jgi:hypothetical protein
VRFQVLTAASMKMTAFCDIAPCSLGEADPRFRRAYCLHHQGDEYRFDKAVHTHTHITNYHFINERRLNLT